MKSTWRPFFFDLTDLQEADCGAQTFLGLLSLWETHPATAVHFPYRDGHRSMSLHECSLRPDTCHERGAFESWVPRWRFKCCDGINTDPVG